MAAKCDQCGIEGSMEAAFFKEHRSFRRSMQTFCLDCWTKRQASAWKQSIFFTLGLGLIGTLFVVWPRRPDYFLLNVFLCQVFLWVGVFPHEFGHAAMARGLGLKVLRIYLGVGPVLGIRRWLGFEIEFRAYPGSGMVLAAHQSRRWVLTKHLAFVLAGPGANLILAAAIWPYLDPGHGWSMRALKGGLEWGWMFFYANVFLLLVALWPSSYMTSLGKLPSDGKQIFETLFLSQNKRSALHAGGFLAEGTLAMENGDVERALACAEKGLSLYPDDELLLNLRGVIWVDLAKYEEARACFWVLLKRESKQPLMQPMMLNNVAYANALLGGEERLREADRFSTEAMKALGWMAAVRGTRGTVLAMLGRYEEARPLLHDAMNEATSAGNKAGNACLIAILETGAGNLEAARQYLAEAKKLDPKCHLLRRAEAAVHEFETGSAG
jgi:tetratricopeptide (TPR) repeat protein